MSKISTLLKFDLILLYSASYAGSITSRLWADRTAGTYIPLWVNSSQESSSQFLDSTRHGMFVLTFGHEEWPTRTNFIGRPGKFMQHDWGSHVIWILNSAHQRQVVLLLSPYDQVSVSCVYTCVVLIAYNQFLITRHSCVSKSYVPEGLMSTVMIALHFNFASNLVWMDDYDPYMRISVHGQTLILFCSNTPK